MERRHFLSLLIAVPGVSMLAACGSDGSSDAPSNTLPSISDPPSPESPISEPPQPPVADAATSVFEFGTYGGFTTREIMFQRAPQVIVTSDGQLITPAEVPAIYPGPLLPQHNVQTISQDGVDALIEAARDAGMLADVTYEFDNTVADAGTATLQITVDGTTYTHAAYALGIGSGPRDNSESSPGRQALSDFVEQLADLESLVGAENLGPVEAYQPDSYQIFAESAGGLSFDDIAPTIVEWDAGGAVSLADATQCVDVARADIGDVFDSATQLTFFRENDLDYVVIARPAYPGRTC